MEKPIYSIKKEKGAIAIFVLVGVLFMAAFLMLQFAGNINKEKTVSEQQNIVQGIYAGEGDNAAYEKAYTNLRNKNKQLMTATVENDNTVELTKTFGEKLSNYRIYGSGSYNIIKEIEVVDLPTEYQQVDYIESTGTQYINTNYIPNQLTKFELTIQYTDNYIGTEEENNGCSGGRKM